MSENVNNLVLEQLRLIREDIQRVESKLTEKIDDLNDEVQGHTGVLVALGRYIHDIDARVEGIEEKIGVGE